MIGGAVEAVVVFCAVVGFFALMSVFGLFPQETVPLLLAVLGAFGCFSTAATSRPLRAGAHGVKVRVTVMPKAGVLDPQGKAIGHALDTLGFGGVGEVRAGKVIELELAETDPRRAKSRRRGHGAPPARQHGDRELPGGDRRMSAAR